jgi:phosphatidylinositol glycan class O
VSCLYFCEGGELRSLQSLLHTIGLYFFTKGFLLTKLVLDFQSECDVFPFEGDQVESVTSSSHGCWHPKTFDKAIVIIIDALRYDFTIPYESSIETGPSKHFHNAIPVLYETASQNPHNAFLLPFIADPPTTTLQRLKGLTTGTLPTFIDAGSNFAGEAIEEDNLLAQLKAAGKRLVHLGDDTWSALFPDYFIPNLTHAYDSLNVWDLHTVDNGVTDHLFPLMNPSNSSKWDIIFGHYLGVDHAGHRYGPDHPAMASKLQQMDQLIRRMISDLDSSTLLVIMGDHGMDVKGDHGGESDDEVQAALWMYSKAGHWGRSSESSKLPPPSAKVRPVGQIDLVPTLSLLLGVPIPFNNLGAPIEEAFIGNTGKDWKNLARASQITSAQIKRYQKEYTAARGSEFAITSKLESTWNEATKHVEASKHGSQSSQKDWKRVQAEFSRYQQETLEICRGLWARFDVFSMLQGISVLSLSIMSLVLYARCTIGDVAEFSATFLSRVIIGTLVGSTTGSAVSSIASSDSMTNDTLFGAAVGSLGGIFMAFLYIRRRITIPLPASFWGLLSSVITISQAIGFASNSYTIWEDEILLFFLTTIGISGLMASIRQPNVVNRALGMYHSILFTVLGRAASLSRLCREEQMPYCRSTYYASSTSSTSAPWQLFIPYILALVLPSIIKSYYQGTKSWEGSASFWVGVAFRLGLLGSAVSWTIDAADDGEWFQLQPGTLKTFRVVLSQLVFGIALAAGTTTFIWAKPCINVEMTPTGRTQATGEARVVDSVSSQSVTILGCANTHGSRYLLLICNALLAIILVQKPMGGGSIGLFGWQILCLLEMIDCNSLSSTAIGPIALAALGNFHFFKTGHQATLQSIQWDSAFIALKTIKYPWSPLLVIGNTFGAQILAALAVPLVVMWKQPPKKKGLLGDAAKATATHLLYHATISLATTMWAYWLRRHLMLYRIFSPRFMTAAAVLLVTDIVGVFIALAALRWNMLSVADVFGF